LPAFVSPQECVGWTSTVLKCASDCPGAVLLFASLAWKLMLLIAAYACL